MIDFDSQLLDFNRKFKDIFIPCWKVWIDAYHREAKTTKILAELQRWEGLIKNRLL